MGEAKLRNREGDQRRDAKAPSLLQPDVDFYKTLAEEVKKKSVCPKCQLEICGPSGRAQRDLVALAGALLAECALGGEVGTSGLVRGAFVKKTLDRASVSKEIAVLALEEFRVAGILVRVERPSSMETSAAPGEAHGRRAVALHRDCPLGIPSPTCVFQHFLDNV